MSRWIWRHCKHCGRPNPDPTTGYCSRCFDSKIVGCLLFLLACLGAALLRAAGLAH